MKNSFLLIFIFFSSILYSQNATLEGKITDSIGNSLAFANVIADPSDSGDIKFSISDDKGNYHLSLKKDISYLVTVSFLGYEPKSFDYSPNDDLIKNFILNPATESLEEVTLEYTPPVIVKRDTIIYRTDAFTSGEERKLRDILKKLPAIDVDREGNVTVKGKRVTKVLIENKEFFTGDSKLAVNNIPADAVDKIEVLDNYNEIGFLKDLEESTEMAMNIKLKENKKKFVFGDTKVGSGIKKRYLIHPTLYYYSPETSVNVIGDFNNTGTKSFTVKDYLDFEGGRNKLMADAKSYFSLINDDFAQYLGNKDFLRSRNQFGAISLNKTIGNKADLSTYGIWSYLRNQTKNQTINKYIVNDNLLEHKSTEGIQKSKFGIGKLELKLKPSNETVVTFSSYLKASNNQAQKNISTFTTENQRNIHTNTDADNLSIKQDIQWYRQFSKRHTTSALFNYHFQKATPTFNWLTSQTILQDLLPVVDEELLNLYKIKKSYTYTLNAVVKHYWVLNRFNHIYLTLGTRLNLDGLETNEYQQLGDGNINTFSTSGFGNDTKLNFNNLLFGVHYKAQKGKVTIKPGLFYHNYNWKLRQLDENVKNNKGIFLPELTTKIEFSNSTKFDFNYNLKTRFASISQFSNRLTLMNYNSLYRGDSKLENELYHQFKARFYRISLSKDIFYNLNINYRSKEKSFKNTTIIEGIDFVSTPVLTNLDDKLLYFNGNLKKGFGNYNISLKSNLSIVNYEKIINNRVITNNSNIYSFGGGVETRFQKLPNVELHYAKSFSEYKAIGRSTFQTNIFSVFIEYGFLTDFILNADYKYESYVNKTLDNKNNFDIANASLFYQREGSAWGFEIETRNVFDVAFKQRNSFSSILVSDEKAFILPRMIMFKLSYKL